MVGVFYLHEYYRDGLLPVKGIPFSSVTKSGSGFDAIIRPLFIKKRLKIVGMVSRNAVVTDTLSILYSLFNQSR